MFSGSAAQRVYIAGSACSVAAGGGGAAGGDVGVEHGSADGVADAMAVAKLIDVIANSDWERGDAQGEFDETWGDQASRFTWQLTVEQWEDASMRELTVNVQWQQRNETQQVSLATVIHADGL